MSRMFFERPKRGPNLKAHFHTALLVGCIASVVLLAWIIFLAYAWQIATSGESASLALHLMLVASIPLGATATLFSLLGLKRAYDLWRQLRQDAKGEKYHYRD